MKGGVKKSLLALGLALALMMSGIGLADERMRAEQVDSSAVRISGGYIEAERGEQAVVDLTEAEGLPEEGIPENISLEAIEQEPGVATLASDAGFADMNAGQLVLGVKEKYRLNDEAPADGQSFTYKSSRERVAKVDDRGEITALKKGVTTITIKAQNGQRIKLKVKVAAAPKSVKLNRSGARMKVGETLRLKAVTSPKKSASRISWESSDTSVVQVDDRGDVTAIAPGKARVTARTYNKKKAVCTIVVGKPGRTASSSIHILSIGNSLSADAHFYLWKTLTSMGYEDVVIGNLYYPSCSLETHLKNAGEDLPNYTYYERGSTGRDVEKARRGSTLEYGLLNRDWDIITLQQYSGDSGVGKSYRALPALIDYVRGYCPSARLAWHMVWAYQKDYRGKSFKKYDRDQDRMYRAIVSAVRKKITTNGDIALIIPTGTAIQNARTSIIGDNLTRDGLHLNYKGKDAPGRYIAALCFACALTGRRPDPNTVYAPEKMSDEIKAISIEAVNNALKRPFRVSSSAYKK